MPETPGSARSSRSCSETVAVHGPQRTSRPTQSETGDDVTRPIRGVIFDKDGTLFDFQATWGAWCRGMISAEAGDDLVVMSRLAEVLGYDLADRRFRADSVIAAPTEVLVERLLPLLPSHSKADLIRRMDALAAAAPQVEAAPLRALLADLAGQGLLLGLATNDVEASARAHLRAAGIEALFGVVACLDSGWGAKPEPGQLLACAQGMGLEPGDCLMVGDSLHDLTAACLAGMRGIAVLTGLADRATLEPAAHTVLRSIAELPRWIADQRRVLTEAAPRVTDGVPACPRRAC